MSSEFALKADQLIGWSLPAESKTKNKTSVSLDPEIYNIYIFSFIQVSSKLLRLLLSKTVAFGGLLNSGYMSIELHW